MQASVWGQGARAKPGTSKGSVKVSWKKDKKATGGYKVLVYAKRGGELVTTTTVPKSKASATHVGALSGYRAVKAK